MADILHRIGIKRPAADVYRALTTIQGLAGWWTQETSGDTQIGGYIKFVFKTRKGDVVGSMGMKVQSMKADTNVVWRCEEGPPDWIGTNITFDLKNEGEFTILLFGHRNWAEASESMAHCSTKWAVFLMSLKDLVTQGKGRPSPEDIKIDNWN